jgi:hypothetical protein
MTTKHKASRGAGHGGTSSQAQGAQGWKQLNSPSGEIVETKSRKKEAPARAKPAKPAKAEKTSGRRTQTKKPADAPPKAVATKDTAVINWLLGLPGHIKQMIFAGCLLVFTIVLAVSLVTRTQPGSVLGPLGNAFYGLLGWGAYLLAIGLAAFAIGHLAESATRTAVIRWGLVVELVLLGCLLVLESRLLFGRDTGMLFGALLAELVNGLPSIALRHIAVLGTMAILLLLIFRITWSQAIGALAWFFGGMGYLARSASGSISTAVEQRRQARAASRALPAYDDDEPDYAPELDDEAFLPEPSPRRKRTFPRLNRRAESAILDEDADLDSLPLPASGSTDDERELPTQPRTKRAAKQATLPGMAAAGAKGSSGAAEATQPQLPPLPMKPGRQAGSASGPMPTVGSSATPRYELPAISLLNGIVEQRQMRQEDVVEELATKVERTLRSFRVDAEVRRSDISVGPTVIRIGIRPVEKVKRDYRGHVVVDEEGEPVIVRTRVSRIMALQNDLALDLEAKTIRMEAPVPGRPYVGVEIPNKNSRLVTLRELLASKEYEESRRKSRLTIALGRDVAGRARVGDLSRFPHLLIAGATGSGKSVCVNSIIACILMQATPEDVRFLMVDPKMVELTGFNGIPHLLAPVVTDGEKVVGVLKRGVIEMERRYRLFNKLGVRNLEAYRKLREQRPELEVLPNIIIIVDELADLMMAAPDEVENLICRLAQLARATGIHLVVATQRPSVDVITGLIKANIPTRISFMVSSAVDSRTIIDMGGAERLLGRGDMLYMPVDAGKPERIQGTFLADEELERIVDHWRQAQPMAGQAQQSWEIDEEDEDDEPEEDDLLDDAEEVVREAGKASASLLQNKLRVGYSRASRLIDQLEARGVIGPAMPGGRPRDILPDDITLPEDRRTGASVVGRQSVTMLPGNAYITGSALSPSGPAPSGHSSALPGRHDSGISHARKLPEEVDEDVEELEWE